MADRSARRLRADSHAAVATDRLHDRLCSVDRDLLHHRALQAADVRCAHDRSRRWRDMAMLAVLCVGAVWPLHLDDGRAEELIRMAEYHLGRRNFDEAARW